MKNQSKQPLPKLQIEQAVLQELRDTPLYSSSEQLADQANGGEHLPPYYFQTHEFVSPADAVARAIRRLRTRVSIVQRYYRSSSMNQAISLWILKEYDNPAYYPVDSWAVHETYDQRVRG